MSSDHFDCGAVEDGVHDGFANTATSFSALLTTADKNLLLSVARRTLECFLYNKSLPEVTADSPGLQQARPAFVTLWQRKTGALRGCRGECIAQRPLVESVALMAIAAAVDDPRFAPVEPDELTGLRIEINALTPLRPIQPEDVVVGRHGLLLVCGRRSGLLLPEVPLRFGWGRTDFLQALCRKAGLPQDAWMTPDAHLLSFESEEWGEDE